MTTKRLVAIAVLVIVAVAVLNPKQIYACGCADQSVEKKYEISSVVFTGTLLSKDTEGGNIFNVDKVWKGNLSDGYVFSGFFGMCGTEFEIGQKYLIYTEKLKGIESTSICNGNQPISNASHDIKILNRLTATNMQKTELNVGYIFMSAMLLSSCTESIDDRVTEKQIKAIQNPDPTLTRVQVKTDGMISDLGYGHPHPFVVGNEVLVDFQYYDTHDVARGDIVVFKTINKEFQDTDMARVVGLPGETINVKKGQVFINRHKLSAFYGKDTSSDNNDSMSEPLKLSENEFFILADVRWRGFNDSQTRGPFKKEDILGKVVGYEKGTS